MVEIINMLRILHFSDAHLDVPHTAADLDAAEVRRAELRAAFSSMMLYIRQNDVRLTLIAGDLLDHAFLTHETTALLEREFASAPRCHFVIAPGNRDYYAADSVYAGHFSDNVHIFHTPAPACFPLEDIGVQVWGFAHTAPDMGEYQPLAALTLAEKQPGVLRIFCGHAALLQDSTAGGEVSCFCGAESGTPPVVTKEQLARLSFDYAALGHAHASDGVRRVKGAGRFGTWTYFGYSGCLVGGGYDECGLKGALCGTFDTDQNGNTAFSVRRLRIARRHYETLDVDFTGTSAVDTDSALAVVQKAIEKAAENGVRLDSDAAVRVTLSGVLPAAIQLTQDALSALLPQVSELEVQDRTTVAHDAALAQDMTLLGAFYREIVSALTDEDEDMRSVGGDALRAGLAAMKSNI
ncbi:MAG: metallophosphoesterase [Clostridia bacterium]|nr:metallophosphoesterase [Clostridia bacterium]